MTLDGFEKTLPALFQGRAYDFHEKPILRFKQDGQWTQWTWENLVDRIELAGRGLIALGIAPGDRVAIFSPNHPHWIVADLAIMSIGAVSVPIHSNSSAAQVAQILEHSNAKAVFASKQEAFKIPASIQEIIILNTTDTGPKTWTDLIGRGENISPALFYDRIMKLEANALATLLYTSGTSGEPKGVMLNHQNILSNCVALAKVFPISSQDHSLSFLPLSHALERTAGLYTMLYVGSLITLCENPSHLSEDLLASKPTLFIAVPRILEKWISTFEGEVAQRSKPVRYLFSKMKDDPKKTSRIYEKLFLRRLRESLGNQIRFIVSGGAPMDPAIGLFFQAAGIPVLEGYGLTEASPVVSVNPPHQNRLGTVGLPLPGIQVKLGPDGEVLVKGQNVMMGYFDNINETTNTIDKDGFLKTGDIGHFDSEGYLRITDRKKELIITSGGKNISPSLLESLLKKSPLVSQACILGEGEKFIAAFLVPNEKLILERVKTELGHTDMALERAIRLPGVRAWFQKVIEETNEQLSPHEAIRRFELLPAEFSIEKGELTPTLKLRRKSIIQNNAELAKDIYK